MDVATMRRAFPGLGAARAAELNSGLNTALRLASCTTVERAAMFCAEELSIPVDEEFQAAAASSSSVAVGDVAFASGA